VAPEHADRLVRVKPAVDGFCHGGGIVVFNGADQRFIGGAVFFAADNRIKYLSQ